MSFKKQSSLARAKYLNSKWKDGSYSVADHLRSGSNSSIGSVVNHPNFVSFANEAYSSPGGYAIRINNRTGEKEMFVRGTTFKRGGVEWVQNILESPVTANSGLGTTISRDVSVKLRRQYSKRLSDVARRHGVSIIYGHSRGAAVVEDMKVPGSVKLALDGATILNSRSTIQNYRQRQIFDGIIGANAKRTVKKPGRVPLWDKRYHRVYQN